MSLTSILIRVPNTRTITINAMGMLSTTTSPSSIDCTRWTILHRHPKASYTIVMSVLKPLVDFYLLTLRSSLLHLLLFLSYFPQYYRIIHRRSSYGISRTFVILGLLSSIGASLTAWIRFPPDFVYTCCTTGYLTHSVCSIFRNVYGVQALVQCFSFVVL